MTPKPCIFFQKGNCKNGDSCRFAHVKGDASSRPNDFSGPRRPPNNSNSSHNPNHRPNPRSGPRHGGRPPYSNSKPYNNKPYDNNNKKPYGGSNPSHSHGGRKNYNNNSSNYHHQKQGNMSKQNSQNVQQSINISDLKELNLKRKNSGLGEMYSNSIVQLGKIVLVIIKNKPLVILFSLENNQFMPNPLYINCDINQKILAIKQCSFGNIEGEFICINYLHFNELSLDYSSRLLITPLSCLDAHKTFLTLNISQEGEINQFHMDQQILLTAVFDQNSNKSQIKLAMINDIAKNSSDLKQLSKIIEESFSTSVVDGKVTNISRVGSNVLMTLSTGRLFVLDVSSSSTQYIEGINGEAILLEMAELNGPGGNEMIMVTNSGDLRLVVLGNPLQSRLTNQMNTPLFKAKCFRFNQGKC